MNCMRTCCANNNNHILSDCKKYIKCRGCNEIFYSCPFMFIGLSVTKYVKFNGICAYDEQNQQSTLFNKIKLFIKKILKY